MLTNWYSWIYIWSLCRACFAVQHSHWNHVLSLAQDTSMVKLCSECAHRHWSTTQSHACFSQLNTSKANGIRFLSFAMHRQYQWLKEGTGWSESRDHSMHNTLHVMLLWCTRIQFLFNWSPFYNNYSVGILPQECICEDVHNYMTTWVRCSVIHVFRIHIILYLFPLSSL